MKSGMKIVPTGLLALVMSSGMVAYSEPQVDANDRPLLARFDEDVARSRREMRKYCAMAQEMMSGGVATDDRKQKALDHLAESRAIWEEARLQYQNNPPLEYANDSRFSARLADISAAMEEMKSFLEDDKSRKSFQSCGFACGLFVAMHEENNLFYAMDKIFHLRRVVRTAMAAERIGGASAVEPFLTELLHQRNRVLLAPCPWPDDAERCTAYRAAFKQCSGILDDLPASVYRNDSETSQLLRHIFATMQEAYGLAL